MRLTKSRKYKGHTHKSLFRQKKRNNMRFRLLFDRVKKEIPNVRIILKKDSVLLNSLFWILRNIFRVKTDFSDYATTIGNTIFVPDTFMEWPSDRQYALLRHELMHLRQFRNWPFKFLGHPVLWYINAIITGFCYIFIFPVFVTLRAKFEREGYAQTILVNYELGLLDMSKQLALINFMAEVFGGSGYFYMWNKAKARRWAMDVIEDCLTGQLVNDKDRVDL